MAYHSALRKVVARHCKWRLTDDTKPHHFRDPTRTGRRHASHAPIWTVPDEPPRRRRSLHNEKVSGVGSLGSWQVAWLNPPRRWAAASISSRSRTNDGLPRLGP